MHPQKQTPTGVYNTPTQVMSGAASPTTDRPTTTTDRPMTRGRVRQDPTSGATRAPALLPDLENQTAGRHAIPQPVNAPDASGATAARPMQVAVSAADEAQLHAASEALQHDDISRTDEDDSRTHAAPQTAEPIPPARTAATVRAGLIAAGMRADSAQDQALLDAVVATILPDVPAPDATAPSHASGRDPHPSQLGELPHVHAAHETAAGRTAPQQGQVGQEGFTNTTPRTLRSTYGWPGVTAPIPTYPRCAACRYSGRLRFQGKLHSRMIRRSFEFRFPQRDIRAERAAAMPYASLAPAQPVSAAPPCSACGLWHGPAECPMQPAPQAPQPPVQYFGRSSFGMRARKPSSFSGKPDENVTHWVQAIEKHLLVASVRGTAGQLITYLSQYLEGAADNWDHHINKDRVGAPQEAFPEWLAALEDEFRPIESAILLRTKFRRITQGTGPLKNHVADFRGQRDEAIAAGAIISDEAARDIFVEGITTASIKQDLWSKLTVDAVDMTCTQVIDRAMRLDANIAMARPAAAQNRSSGRAPVAVAEQASPDPRPPGGCFECGSTNHIARECPHRSDSRSWRALPAPPPLPL